MIFLTNLYSLFIMNLLSIIIKRSKIFSILLLSFFVTVSLSACNPILKTSNANQVPQVVQAILSDPKTFNAVLSQESPNIFGLTYEGLIKENPLTGEKEPALAESW